MRAVVRVGADGLSSGAGFLLAPDLVATCAHVVAEALDVDPGPEPPGGELDVDLPLSPGRPSRRARVERWLPPGADGGGDIALLRLDGPVTEPVPALRRLDEPWGRQFRAAGFPSGREDGVWAAGRFREEQGSGWVQLVSEDGPAVGPGFSGTPVWDADGGSVVAMAVAADRVTGRHGSAYALPVDQVLELAPEVLLNPYRGLAAFTEDDAEFFFGRDADVARCRETLDREGLLVLAGGSGAGKSSVLLAGLAPAERVGGRLVAHVRPSGAAGPDAFVGDVVAALDGVAPGDWAGFLAGSGDVPAGEGAVLLVVDQMEELAAADPDRAHPALETLLSLAGAGVRVAVTFRWAGFDALPADDLAATLRRATVPLAPLDRDGLRRAVAEPARRVPGPSFEAGLVARIVDDAGDEPGRLPLVQALLAELWDERDGGLLTGAAYERAGAVQGALVRAAERVWSSLDPADRPVARAVLVELTRPAGDGFVRVPVALSDLDSERVRVVRLLADRRLVVIGSTPDSDVAELAHQALVDRWPRLRDWLAEDVAFLRWRDGLRDAVRRWSPDRDPDRLLRGTDLDAALGWRRDRAADLAPDERELVDASERRRRRNRRLRLAGVAVLVVLVLVAGTLAAVATSSNRQLTRALATANSRSLAQLAQGRLAGDPELGAQFALAAYREDPQDPEARSALGQAYLTRRSTVATYDVPGGGRDHWLVAAADTDVIGLSTTAGAVVGEGLDGGSPTFSPVPGSTPETRPVAVYGRGRWIVLTDPSTGLLRSWDRQSPDPPRTLGTGIASATGTGDGTTMLVPVRAVDGTDVRLLDVTTGGSRTVVRLPDRDVLRVDATPNPELLFVRTGSTGVAASTTLTLRDVRTGAVVRTYPTTTAPVLGGSAVVRCEQPSPDPTATTVDAVLVEDALTGARRQRLTTAGVGAAFGCSYTFPHVKVSGDGRHLAWVSDKTSTFDVVQLADLTDGHRSSVWAPKSAGIDQETENTNLSTVIGGSTSLSVRGDRLLVPDAGGMSVLALSNVPAWRDSGRIDGSKAYPGHDGAFALVVRSGDLSTVRTADGTRIGTLPAAAVGLAPGEVIQTAVLDREHDVIDLVVGSPRTARIVEYGLPTFHPLGGYDLSGAGVAGLPLTDAPERSAVAQRAGDHLAVLAGGTLSWWSVVTHRMVAPPAVLTGDASVATDLSHLNATSFTLGGADSDLAAIRPPGELGGLSVYRLGSEQPTRIAAEFLAGGSGGALVYIGSDGVSSIEVPGVLVRRDPFTGAVSAPPSAVPATLQDILGTDPTGRLVTTDHHSSDVHALAFWDQRTNRAAGRLDLPSSAFDLNTPGLVDDRWDIDTGDDLVSITVDDAEWRAQLCRTTERPFADAALALFPPGADTAPPCSDG